MMDGYIRTFFEHYAKCPPERILDNDGVRLLHSYSYGRKYVRMPCSCGTIHFLDDDTWYHYAFDIVGFGVQSVFRACKECHEVLQKERVK